MFLKLSSNNFAKYQLVGINNAVLKSGLLLYDAVQNGNHWRFRGDRCLHV